MIILLVNRDIAMWSWLFEIRHVKTCLAAKSQYIQKYIIVWIALSMCISEDRHKLRLVEQHKMSACVYTFIYSFVSLQLLSCSTAPIVFVSQYIDIHTVLYILNENHKSCLQSLNYVQGLQFGKPATHKGPVLIRNAPKVINLFKLPWIQYDVIK